ncbi:MAG: hypothetical protein Q9210_005781 [Variospora velana]
MRLESTIASLQRIHFLGDTTIGTLLHTAEALGNAGHYFTEVSPPADGLRRLSTYKKDAKAESHSDNAEDCNQNSHASIVLRKIRRLPIWKTVFFDSEIAEALEGAVDLQEFNEEPIDIMSREEVFLVASFVLNLRQAASHIEEMLKHSEFLVLQRQSKHNRRRFYAPRIKWSKWLYSGGEEDEALPATGRKSNRKGENDEKADEEDDMYHHRCKDNLIATSDREADLEAGKAQAPIWPNLLAPIYYQPLTSSTPCAYE